MGTTFESVKMIDLTKHYLVTYTNVWEDATGGGVSTHQSVEPYVFKRRVDDPANWPPHIGDIAKTFEHRYNNAVTTQYPDRTYNRVHVTSIQELPYHQPTV